MLSQKTADTLFNVVSNFYNIKTDIGISIIDGPIVSSVLRKWLFVITLSLIVGLTTSWALSILLGLLEKTFKLGTYSFKKSPLAGLKDRFNTPIKKETSIEKKKEDFFEDVPYHFKEISDKKSAIKSSSAPSNLPIADEMSFIFEDPKEEEIAKEENFIQLKKEEPSEEEMKKRLNTLLMGDM